MDCQRQSICVETRCGTLIERLGELGRCLNGRFIAESLQHQTILITSLFIFIGFLEGSGAVLPFVAPAVPEDLSEGVGAEEAGGGLDEVLYFGEGDGD